MWLDHREPKVRWKERCPGTERRASQGRAPWAMARGLDYFLTEVGSGTI